MSNRVIRVEGDVAYKAAAKRLHGEFALTAIGVN